MTKEYFLVHATVTAAEEIICPLPEGDERDCESYWGSQSYRQPVRHFKSLKRAIEWGYQQATQKHPWADRVEVEIKSIRPGESSVLEFVWDAKERTWLFAS